MENYRKLHHFDEAIKVLRKAEIARSQSTDYAPNKHTLIPVTHCEAVVVEWALNHYIRDILTEEQKQAEII